MGYGVVYNSTLLPHAAILSDQEAKEKRYDDKNEYDYNVGCVLKQQRDTRGYLTRSRCLHGSCWHRVGHRQPSKAIRLFLQMDKVNENSQIPKL